LKVRLRNADITESRRQIEGAGFSPPAKKVLTPDTGHMTGSFWLLTSGFPIPLHFGGISQAQPLIAN
jgi:hypothetical protein